MKIVDIFLQSYFKFSAAIESAKSSHFFNPSRKITDNIASKTHVPILQNFFSQFATHRVYFSFAELFFNSKSLCGTLCQR